MGDLQHWILPGKECFWILLVVLLGHLTEVAGVCRCRCAVECPPQFPDFEDIFRRTLSVQPWLRMKLEEMKISNWQKPCCTYSPSLMGNISQFNKYRCKRVSELDMQCYSTSTSSTSSVGTTRTSSSSVQSTYKPETSIRTSKPKWTPNLPSSRSRRETTEPTFFTSVIVTISSPSSQKPEVPIAPNTILPPHSPTPVAGATNSQIDQKTVAIACAVVGAILIILIILGLICRNRSCAGVGAAAKRAKVQRQKSDCRPITLSSTPTTDTSDSTPPTPNPAVPGSIINHRFVTNGPKWRPQAENSETGSGEASVHSQEGAKYILLREDSNMSALSHHYNTLNAIDHPHALSLGGFGESSTDPNEIEGFAFDESQFAGSKIPKSRENLYIQNEKKLVDKNKNKLGQLSSPSFMSQDSGHGSSESDPPSVEGDRNSLVGEDTVDDQGINNPVFAPEEEYYNSNNNATAYVKYNPTSTESLQSGRSVIEPPPEFRDSETPLAVVKPSVLRKNGGHMWILNPGGRPQSEGPQGNVAKVDVPKGPHVVTISMEDQGGRPAVMVKPNNVSISNAAHNAQLNGHHSGHLKGQSGPPNGHSLPRSTAAVSPGKKHPLQ